MDQVMDFLKRPIYAVNGFQITVGVVVLAVLVIYLLKKYK